MDDYAELIDQITRIDNSETMTRLFDELFTEKERYDLLLRWKLMKDLYRAVPQRDIAGKLKISLCKITRGSRILKREDSVCRRLIGDLTTSETPSR